MEAGTGESDGLVVEGLAAGGARRVVGLVEPERSGARLGRGGECDLAVAEAQALDPRARRRREDPGGGHVVRVGERVVHGAGRQRHVVALHLLVERDRPPELVGERGAGAHRHVGLPVGVAVPGPGRRHVPRAVAVVVDRDLRVGHAVRVRVHPELGRVDEPVALGAEEVRRGDADLEAVGGGAQVDDGAGEGGGVAGSDHARAAAGEVVAWRRDHGARVGRRPEERVVPPRPGGEVADVARAGRRCRRGH